MKFIDTFFSILIDKLRNGATALPAVNYNAGAYSLEGELNLSVYIQESLDFATSAMRNWKTGDGTASNPLYVAHPTNFIFSRFNY